MLPWPVEVNLLQMASQGADPHREAFFFRVPVIGSCPRLGLVDRGQIAVGKKAEVVIFDAQSTSDTATFEDPLNYPTGIHHVLVNGKVVVDEGQHTGAKPGRVLRRTNDLPRS